MAKLWKMGTQPKACAQIQSLAHTIRNGTQLNLIRLFAFCHFTAFAIFIHLFNLVFGCSVCAVETTNDVRDKPLREMCVRVRVHCTPQARLFMHLHIFPLQTFHVHFQYIWARSMTFQYYMYAYWCVWFCIQTTLYYFKLQNFNKQPTPFTFITTSKAKSKQEHFAVSMWLCALQMCM